MVKPRPLAVVSLYMDGAHSRFTPVGIRKRNLEHNVFRISQAFLISVGIFKISDKFTDGTYASPGIAEIADLDKVKGLFARHAQRRLVISRGWNIYIWQEQIQTSGVLDGRFTSSTWLSRISRWQVVFEFNFASAQPTSLR